MQQLITELIHDSISSISIEERVSKQELNNKINFLRYFIEIYGKTDLFTAVANCPYSGSIYSF